MEDSITVVIAVTGSDISEHCKAGVIQRIKGSIEHAARSAMELEKIAYDPFATDSYEPKESGVSILIK
jgi:hypothetical protein